MKFITQVPQLKAVLQRIGLAITPKALHPLDNILIDVENGHVTFTTTDTNITISYRLECETEGTDTALIPFAEFKNIIGLETGDITVEIDGDSKIWVRCASDNFCLGEAGKPEEFPKLTKVAEKRMFQINGSFLPSLLMASLGVSTDELKPALTCVLVEITKERLAIVSCGGHALYMREIFIPFPVEQREELLIPARVAKVLDGFTSTKFGFTSNHVAFESSGVTVLCKRGAAKFPDYRSIIPIHTGNVVLKLEDIEKALDKALIVATSNTYGIDFIIGPEDMDISVTAEDTGMSAKCTIPANAANCTTGNIRLNGRLLKLALKQIGGHCTDESKINLSVQAPNKSVTLRIEGHDDVTILVMPIIQD